jgi:hypothetical protein
LPPLVDAGLTVRDTGWQTELALRSTAQTVKEAVPVNVVVPVNRPLRLRDIPIGGKPPEPNWK